MADFGVTEDGHPDEVALPGSHQVAPKPLGHQAGLGSDLGASRPMQPPSKAPLARSSSSGQQARPQPQTPQAAQRSAVSNQNRPQPQQTGRPTAPAPAQVSTTQAAANAQTSTPPPAASNEQFPDGPVAFFSARSVKVSSDAGSTVLPISGGKLFDPKLESPSIPKTPGIDHTSTKPVGRDRRHVNPPKKDEEPPQRPAGGFGNASGSTLPASMANVVNPSLHLSRQIGAPGSHSPMGNKGAYKPPTMMKRPADGGARPPLNEVTTNSTVGVGVVGTDAKRQKID